MRVLWVCNIMIPVIAKALELPYSNREGWLTGLADRILSPKNAGQVELGICFPVDAELGAFARTLEFAEGISCKCYGFEENLGHPERYDAGIEKRMASIIADFAPDIVHVFGTEFPHSLAAVRVFNNPDRTLLGIQGICSEIAEHYALGLPLAVKYSATFRDVVRRDSIRKQIEKFRRRAVNETEAILYSGNITGRTAFDQKYTSKMNPVAKYHAMNETMRSCFYQDSWRLEMCEKYSMFLSQGDYPLKGFHFVLQAMPRILEKHPTAMLYVAGANILKNETWKDRLKRCGYAKYLQKLIRSNHLQGHVVMLDKLSAEDMKQRFLACHVFVCPSTIENSPNSLGEAMLLGVPCVASKTGGIPDLLVDGQDGLLFENGNVEQLADKLLEIMDKEEITKLYSNNAKRHAYVTHDQDTNFARLLAIYKNIAEAACLRGK